VNEICDACLASGVLPSGALEVLEWSVNEVTGNILDHSGEQTGVVQVVFLPAQQHVAFVVCDNGCGIPTAMRSAFPAYSKDEEALAAAVEKGITSDSTGNNRGYGLAGLIAIAQQCDGYANILSGRAKLSVRDAQIHCNLHFPPVQGTVVDLNFSTSSEIDAENVLGVEPVSYFETEFEANQSEEYQVDLAEKIQSFGNRPAGQRAYNLISNLLSNSPSARVIVDMSGVRLVTSSFADEFFGTLFTILGPVGFMTRIELKNLTGINRSIVDDAINERARNPKS